MADEIVLHVTEANYEDTVVKCDKPVLLAIGAPWCIDCKRIEPMFMEYAQKYHDKIRLLTAISIPKQGSTPSSASATSRHCF